MNKSLEYIKNRINNTTDTLDNIPLDGWDEAIIINPMERLLCLYPSFKSCFKNESELNYTLSCDLGKTDITIIFDDTVNFDYFTSETSTHDGTLLFTEQLFDKLLFKVLRLETYYKNNVQKDFIDNPFNYKIKYTIGNIILHRDFGMKNINGHNWSGETDLVVLPIKFEATKKPINS